MNYLRGKGLRFGGFTLTETMVGLAILGVVMGAVYTSSTALLGSMKASENYSVGQLAVVDYLTLDLRRCQSFPTFTTVNGQLTLPLTLNLPKYYAADGKTPVAPQRQLVTSANVKGKKDHKVFSARYYYFYDSLSPTITVTYSLSSGTLKRTEVQKDSSGTVLRTMVRTVGTGIASVTFGPSLAAIKADPVVNATVTFSTPNTVWSKTNRPPPPLCSTTFMRHYYYSDL